MRIAISGASGFLGRAFTDVLARGGHHVLRLARTTGAIDLKALEGADAVVNFSGESIAGGRWTKKRQHRIRESRVGTTDLLARALAGFAHPPRVFISASAVGIYGDRGGEIVDEDSATGAGFLAEVAAAWEAAAAPAAKRGIRVVHPRFGMVLSPVGGALVPLLRLFRLGLGGRVGNGCQFMSWVALDDALRALQQALTDETLSGPFNVVAPTPVTNAEFTKALAKALRRPALLPVPAVAVRLFLGEMGRALLLEGARVAPTRLLRAGFQFQFPTLESFLRGPLFRAPKEHA